MPDEIVYDVTNHYSGSGIESKTFNLYQPTAGQTVTSVVVDYWRSPAAGYGYDNENDYEVEINIFYPWRDITISSSNVTFDPIIDSSLAREEIIMLGPHDDPDGIDTLDAFQTDSGSDWAESGTQISLIYRRTVLDPDDIATFLGTGTFDILSESSNGWSIVELTPPGVSELESLIQIESGFVRVSMTAVPEPSTVLLLMLGASALVIRRQLSHNKEPDA